MPLSSRISIQLQSPRWKTRLPSYAKVIRGACKAALQKVSNDRCRVSEITIVLANDAFIRTLNKTYRGKDKPTNVLSFSNLTPDTRPSTPDTRHLGDIVLAFETIAREAKEQGKSFKDHVAHLVVHGTLHLLGHDHMKKKEAERMEALEVKILKKLGIENPYCEKG